jgi:hypothetical protein
MGPVELTLTRRSLLLAGAGALAASATRPLDAIAALTGPAEPWIRTLEIGTLGVHGRTLRLPPGVDVVGLGWRGPAGAKPRIRVRRAGGEWGPWASAAAHGHGPEGAAPDPRGERTGEPLWIGGSRELQMRCGQPLDGVLLHLVGERTPALAQPGSTAALALAQPVLAAGPGQPAIVARKAWAGGRCPPKVAPEYGAVELAFVHHTENPNGYGAAEVPAMLRSIYAFHRFVNGWNDIGYNFVVDLYGRVFEARAGGIDEPVVGAHAGGYNLVSTGVAVLGSFAGVQISPAAKSTLERLIAWKLALHGTPVSGRVTVRTNPAGAGYSKFPAGSRISLPRIAGHRDADSTECPGDALYGELPAIRARARRLLGDPVSATVELLPAPPPAPAGGEAGAPPPTPQPPIVQVSLTRLLDGTPLAGAAVVLQARTVSRRGEAVLESTLAEGATDAQGLWGLPASFAAGAPKPLWVRALYLGGAGTGAAVSRAVRLAPLPALTQPTATAPSA